MYILIGQSVMRLGIIMIIIIIIRVILLLYAKYKKMDQSCVLRIIMIHVIHLFILFYKTITTVDSDTQFTFSDVGVYDISAHIQEIVPPKMVVNPDGSVTQGNFLYTDHGPQI